MLITRLSLRNGCKKWLREKWEYNDHLQKEEQSKTKRE